MKSQEWLNGKAWRSLKTQRRVGRSRPIKGTIQIVGSPWFQVIKDLHRHECIFYLGDFQGFLHKASWPVGEGRVAGEHKRTLFSSRWAHTAGGPPGAGHARKQIDGLWRECSECQKGPHQH